MTTPREKTVFISSTYEDLIPHRQLIWDLLNDYNVNIRGMEEFGARSETPLETCLAEVEQSDIYIGVISCKLGSIEKNSGKSFTQLEYEKAFELNHDIFIYLIDEINCKINLQNIDFDENHVKLQNFKSLLKSRHNIDTFVDENDLTKKLKKKFDELSLRKKIICTDDGENIMYLPYSHESFINYIRSYPFVGIGYTNEEAYNNSREMGRRNYKS